MQKHYLWLIVVLNAHSKDVDADDEGDEEVQVVAGTQRVNGQTQGGVVSIVRPLLGLWRAQTNMWKGETMRNRDGQKKNNSDT